MSDSLGITTGPDGALWFTEYVANQIGRITTAGVLTQYPIPTGGSAPVGITAGPDGNLWFAERFGEKIGRITTAGIITEFPVGNDAYRITAGPDGNLWFTTEVADKIGRITPGGAIMQFPLTAGSDPIGITAGPDGNLWFTEQLTVPGSNRIGKITPAGVIMEFSLPTATNTALYPITASTDGNLWFTDVRANQIGRITPAGVITEFPIPTANSGAYGITAGPDGNLWFTEYSANQLGRITPAGVVTEFFISTGGGNPYWITTGPDGNLWLTDANTIVKATIPNIPPGTLTIHPTTGGNAGSVTVEIFGSGFQSGATVKLTGLGLDIVGMNTTVPNASVLKTTFDLTGATPGIRNVVITNPDNTTAMLTGGFTVEQGGAPDVWLDIIGRDVIRIGHEQSFYIVYGNRGTLDAYDVPLFLTVPTGVQVLVDGLQVPSGSAPPAAWNAVPTIQTSSGSRTPMWFYSLPAASSGVIRIGLVASGDTSIEAEISQPIDSTFSRTGDIHTIPPHLDAFFKQLAHQVTLAEIGSLSSAGAVMAIAPRAQAQSTCAGLPEDAQDACWQDRFRGILPGILGALDPRQYATGWALGVSGAGLAFYGIEAGGGVLLTGGTALLAVGAALELWHLYELIQVHRQIQKQLTGVQSLDPNVKIGPQGVGAASYVAASAPLGYSVYFDDQPTATAPAQAVTIADTLNTNFDLTTLTLGPLTFPNQVVTPPSIPLSIAPFTTTVDLRPTTNLLVKINTSLNTSTSVLTWNFQSLDPNTGLPPTDPLAGFLPPGAEGSVFFTVTPKSTVTTGTVIQNTATVVFDVNPPINTPTWSNTIDATPPTSRVASFPSTETWYSFPVQWSGSDIGSGVQDFTIYVADNGGPFTTWLTNTTSTQATYTGVGGHTYGFFSIARDLVGNVENAKTIAEATTRVVVDTTPPVIVPLITGTLGNNGWYRSNVTVTWSVTDPESGIASSSGCTATTLSTDTAGVTLTCSATNGAGLSSSITVTIKIDKTPPVISGMPAPACTLWPPNHKLVQVGTVTATDALSGLAPGSFKVTGTSNEPSNPNDPQIVITPNGSGGFIVQLQADRSGTGIGRVYTLTAVAADLAGNSATTTATCTVPHDQGH